VAKLYAFRIGGPEARPTDDATAEPTAEATAEPTGEATAEPTGVVVPVSGGDLFYDPDSLTIPADTDVTITLTNDGAVQHDLFQPDMDVQTDILEAGESGSVVVNLPAGTYRFWCTVPGHRDAGMSGTLTVE
jgi:nitrite reductase (NO-forming)